MRVPSHCSYTGGVCLPLVVLCPSYQPVKLSHNSLWPAVPTHTRLLKTKTHPNCCLIYCPTASTYCPTAQSTVLLRHPQLPAPTHQFRVLWGISLIPQAKPVLYILLIFTTAACSQTSLCQQDITTTLDMQEMTTYILAMEMFSTTPLVVQMTATTPLTMSLVSMLCLCLAMPLYAVL